MKHRPDNLICDDIKEEPQCKCGFAECRYPCCPAKDVLDEFKDPKETLHMIEKANPLEEQLRKVKYGFHGPLSISDLFLFFRIISADVPCFPELERPRAESERFERAMNEWIPMVLKKREWYVTD